MNLILTSSCNKGCPYCFASEDRKNNINNKNSMTLEQFNSIIDKIPPSTNPIKLLGGEPTQHPQFKEIVNSLISRNRSITIISNFLFNDDILNFLCEKVLDYRITFLINSTNLDIKDRIELFKKNYNTLYKVLYQVNAEENLSCGITIENDKNAEYYINYIDFLIKNLFKIERLRISISFPGRKEDKNFNIINNKSIGEMLLSIVYKTVNSGIQPSLDCVIFPCLFKNKEELKYIKKFTNNFKYKCTGNPPTDIFFDDTVSYCYPLREAIKINLNDYEKMDEVVDALNIKYTTIKYNIDKPNECLSCIFYNNECEGPCLGFYNI